MIFLWNNDDCFSKSYLVHTKVGKKKTYFFTEDIDSGTKISGVRISNVTINVVKSGKKRVYYV